MSELEKNKGNEAEAVEKNMPDDEYLYDLADLFRIFGDTTRIRILYSLFDNELCVGDISNALRLSQSSVSHQLRILKDSKLVKFRREGKSIFYSLDEAAAEGYHPCFRCRPDVQNWQGAKKELARAAEKESIDAFIVQRIFATSAR